MSHTRINADEKNPGGHSGGAAALGDIMNHGGSLSGKEKHCVFLNTGGDSRADKKFACVSAISGLNLPDDGRGVVVTDWDGDGDLDLWLSNRNAPRIRYFRNNSHTGNNFIALQPIGNGQITNRDAVGARVEVFLKPETRNKKQDPSQVNRLVKTVHLGQGFLSQSSRWLHFGLGRGDSISKVTVNWPGGKLQEFSGLEINQKYQLHQSGEATLVPKPITTPPLPASSPQLPEQKNQFRIALIENIIMPNLPYKDEIGINKTFRDAQGDGLLLINCWSTTCIPCLQELKDFTDHAETLRDANINVLALCLDSATEDEVAASGRALEVLSKMGFPFSYGEASRKVARTLANINGIMTSRGGVLPVPTSFLIDTEGKLIGIYKGTVSTDTLIADKDQSSLPLWKRYLRAANFPGTLVEDEITESALFKAGTLAHMAIKDNLAKMGWSGPALEQSIEVAQRLPESNDKQSKLGNLYFEQGLMQAGGKHWRASIDAFKKSLDYQKATPNILHNIAIGQQNLGQIEKARIKYGQALKLEPSFLPARKNLGRLYASEKNWAEAENHFQRAIDLEPGDPITTFNLGVALTMQKKWVQATAQFKRALELDPDLSATQKYLDYIKRNSSLKEPQ